MVEKNKKIKMETNIVSKEEYRNHAKQTLDIIKEALSQSLGYYGSTSILEDKVLGNTVTKDGYTILNQIKFGTNDTISNTLLRMIKGISRSLVMEVGDGSTSAVVTSQALFNELISNGRFINEYSDIPPKIIIDKLNVIEKKVKEILREKATSINDNNFIKLKDIAAVSNNNDSEAGNIIYDVYKEIGKDGFVTIEKGFSEEDYYEVTNGIETSYGMQDKIFSNKANGFESEYNDPKVIIIKGQLTHEDIKWFSQFLGTFFSMNPSIPLVIVSTGYDREFLNFLKINYEQNNRQAGVNFNATIFNSNREEELEDLALYLNAKIIDKTDDNIYQLDIDPFMLNDQIKSTEFITTRLGSCKQIFMNMNFTRFIEGNKDDDKIKERIDFIQKEINYFKENNYKNNEVELFRLEKRIANLNSKIAKLYITGNSDTEIDTRKYLFEDAIFASKSALEHGYISGGNLAVSRAIDDLVEKEYKYFDGNSDDEYYDLEIQLVELVKNSFLEVYNTVLTNAFYTREEANNIILNCLKKDTIYNIKTKQYENIDETSIINSVMTDIRIMESVFSIISLLVTSNQYIRTMPR